MVPKRTGSAREPQDDDAERDADSRQHSARPERLAKKCGAKDCREHDTRFLQGRYERYGCSRHRPYREPIGADGQNAAEQSCLPLSPERAQPETRPKNWQHEQEREGVDHEEPRNIGDGCSGNACA